MVRKMSRSVVAYVLILLTLIFSAAAEESLSLNAVPSSGKAPLEVSFDLTSSEEVVSVSWDFDGDGTWDSNELSPKHIYSAGKYTAAANVTTSSGSTVVSTTVNVNDPFSVSVIAAPSSGIAPLNVKFTSVVSGSSGPFLYAWDFNQDGKADSTEQNPTYIFEDVGDINVALTVTDAASSSMESKVSKEIPVTVSSYDSKINIVSYFPTALQLKENQVTFLVANEGPETIKDISAKIIGEGLQHMSSTTISRLKPGEQDSLTVKLQVLKDGEIAASVKIDEKIFPLTFKVAEQIKVNREELELQLNELKQKLQEQEDLYYQKKADGYLVEEVFDSIKSIKKQLQDVQQQMLTNHLEEAQVNFDLAAPSIEEITRRLDTAVKEEQTVLMWMKENAVAITSIIAAVGTLGGVAVKLSKGAQKIGSDVKDKLSSKLKKEPVKEEKAQEKAADQDDSQEDQEKSEEDKENSS